MIFLIFLRVGLSSPRVLPGQDTWRHSGRPINGHRLKCVDAVDTESTQSPSRACAQIKSKWNPIEGLTCWRVDTSRSSDLHRTSETWVRRGSCRKSQGNTWRHEERWILLNVIAGLSWSNGPRFQRITSIGQSRFVVTLAHRGDAWKLLNTSISIGRIMKEELDRAIRTAQLTWSDQTSSITLDSRSRFDRG